MNSSASKPENLKTSKPENPSFKSNQSARSAQSAFYQTNPSTKNSSTPALQNLKT